VNPTQYKVAGQVTLSGLSVSTFTIAHQEVFQQSLATELLVDATSVFITSVTDARRRRRLGEGRSAQRQLAGSLSIAYEVRGIPVADADRAVSSITALSTGAGSSLTDFVATLKQDFTDAGQLSPASLTVVFAAPTWGEYVPATPAPVPVPSEESKWYDEVLDVLDEDWKLYSAIAGAIVFLILVIALLMKLCCKRGKNKKEKLSKAAEKLKGLSGSPTAADKLRDLGGSSEPATSIAQHLAAEDEFEGKGQQNAVGANELEHELEQSGVSAAAAAVIRASAGIELVPNRTSSMNNRGPMLPAGWQAIDDPESGQDYYYNTLTGESVWEPPTQPASMRGNMVQQASIADPVGFAQTEQSLGDYQGQLDKQQRLYQLQQQIRQQAASREGSPWGGTQQQAPMQMDI
jgi:hypothetical protein